MKRFLSIGSMFALALVIGVVFAPSAQGDNPFAPGLPDLGKRIEESFAGLDDAARAAYEAGSFTSTVRDISMSTTGGFACEGTTVKGATSRGIRVTAANGRQAIVTASSEDALKRIFSAVMAAQLAGLNVNFLGMATACPNVSNITELTITK